MKSKTKRHGGPRANSGRTVGDPALVRNSYPIRLPQWIIDQLDIMQAEQAYSKGELVEAAVVWYYKLKP